MTLAVGTIRPDLSALVGEAQVQADPAICAALTVDGKMPEIVVSPHSAEQVAAVLRYANHNRLAVIPRGSGTKISTGMPPRQYDIALSLLNLKRVVHYESADLTTGVEAGTTLAELQKLVGRDGLWLPIDPRGYGESSIGGIIASGATGPLRQGHGGPRDMVIGLKIATADGKIAKTGGRVVKNVAGYDFCKLLTGSMGTLGVVVEANLKLFPTPPQRATFRMKVGDLAIARDLRRAILRSPLDPMRLVLLDPAAIALVGEAETAPEIGHSELWIELGGSHRVIERCMLDLRHLSSSVGAHFSRQDDAEPMWERIANLTHWLEPRYPAVVILKATLPLLVMEEWVSRAQQEARSSALSVAALAQVGVGIVHVCVLQQNQAAGVAAYIHRLRQTALDLGGTLIVEHGSTELKSTVNVWGACGDDLKVMHQLKGAWDPNGVLSPGRFVDGI